MADAFYLPDGDRFLATELTRGPWDPGLQHAGPPAALLGRAVEARERHGMQVVRVTFEILRPVPIGPLRVGTRLLRAGRSVELLEASLRAGDAEVMRATALRMRAADLPLPEPAAQPDPLPPPDQGRPVPFFPTGQPVGYHTAMDVRFVAGSFLDPGPAAVWMRMRHPLLPAEPPSPLVRVLVAADSGNGVSAVLDWRRWRFVNADLTVSLFRQPAGQWVGLDARTSVSRAGVGLAASTLHDEHGPIGHGLQSLLVDRR
jgi:hypothetical protein